ncbi:hypothetical protein E2C01_014661 [Portunus trituberculatus]|uniref:Uncharacterized protein n=1 Tax=Portunus trituberculatus TaxID=210409 RepID=A0A5B7DKT4_PORTR|nr:hypothetical protein [Portunus trituberculatus]
MQFFIMPAYPSRWHSMAVCAKGPVPPQVARGFLSAVPSYLQTGLVIPALGQVQVEEAEPTPSVPVLTE